MEINHIECFLNVAKTLNFSEAARRSYISQSMVSRYIERLEKELGSKLFIRTNKEVKLTSEGKTFLPYATEIVDNMNKAKFAIEQLHTGYEGRLRIVCDFAASEVAAKCLGEFSKRYPGVAIDISELHGEDIKISDNSADVVFSLRDMIADNVDYLITHKDTLSLVFKKGYCEEKKALNILKENKFVILSELENPILYMEIMDIFHSERIVPKIVSRPDSIKSVLTTVEAGLGVSILPTRAVMGMMSNSLDSIEMTEIDTALVYAVAWNSNSTNPAVNLFLETVKEYSKDTEYEY